MILILLFPFSLLFQFIFKWCIHMDGTKFKRFRSQSPFYSSYLVSLFNSSRDWFLAFQLRLCLKAIIVTSFLHFFPKRGYSSVQSLSHVRLFATPGTTAYQASLSITNSQSLLKLMSIESVMPSNHLIFCHPLLLPPSIIPNIRIFSNESVLHIRWPKDCNFGFNICPSNEYAGLIFFRLDWLDLLAIQGTLKSLLQHHSSKPSIFWCSTFFTVQLSHPYMIIGKNIALTGWTLLAK